MTNNFFKNNYTAVLGSESRPGPDLGSRSNTGLGPGPGSAKVAGPDLDWTVDRLVRIEYP